MNPQATHQSNIFRDVALRKSEASRSAWGKQLGRKRANAPVCLDDDDDDAAKAAIVPVDVNKANMDIVPVVVDDAWNSTRQTHSVDSQCARTPTSVCPNTARTKLPVRMPS